MNEQQPVQIKQELFVDENEEVAKIQKISLELKQNHSVGSISESLYKNDMDESPGLKGKYSIKDENR